MCTMRGAAATPAGWIGHSEYWRANSSTGAASRPFLPCKPHQCWSSAFTSSRFASPHPVFRCPMRNPHHMHAAVRVGRHARGHRPPPCQRRAAPKNDAAFKAQDRQLIRWSIQEIRRIASRLARRRIEPSYIIAWSLWRRAHQAAAQQAHLKSKAQL